MQTGVTLPRGRLQRDSYHLVVDLKLAPHRGSANIFFHASSAAWAKPSLMWLGLFCNNKLPMSMKFSSDCRVRPNIASDLRISQRTILRQKEPYSSHCIDRFPDKYSYIEKFYNYSESHCIIACTAAIIVEKCGCLEQCFAMPKVSRLACRVFGLG